MMAKPWQVVMRAARMVAAATTLAFSVSAHADSPQFSFRVVAPLQNIGTYQPQGKLALGSDGRMYGTTNLGTASTGLYGGVYRVEASGQLTTIHAFNDYVSGSQPVGALLSASDGWLYGTTLGGGAHQWGTIFRVAPDGRFETLHHFDPVADGTGNPLAALVQGADGTLYGTGYSKTDLGNVFAYHGDGRVVVLHSFTTPAHNGADPCGVTFGSDGKLYGATFKGGSGLGGLLYSLTADGAYSVVHELDCAVDGCNPQGPLLMGPTGALYGTTANGGRRPDGSAGLGTVFRWGRQGLEVVHVFAQGAPEGARPALELSQDKVGRLYGATELGAAGFGTVFRIDIDGSVETLHTFTGLDDGGFPWTSPALTGDGSVMGVTTQGGAAQLGTVYEIRRANAAAH